MPPAESKSGKGYKTKILIGLVTVILIVLMFPKGESIESEVTEGSIWVKDDLIAPFSFPVFKDPLIYNAEIENARKKVFPVFQPIEPENKYIDSLKNYSLYLIEAIDKSLSADSLKEFNPTFLSAASYKKFQFLRQQEKNFLQSNGLNLRKLFSEVNKILSELYRRGIINIPTDEYSNDTIAVRIGKIDKIELMDRFLLLSQAISIFESEIKKFDYPVDLESALIEYGKHFLYPNIVFNEKFTKEEIEQAQNSVSKYAGIINENERIVAKHDRITKDIKLKIDSYKEAKGESIGNEGIFLQFIGKCLHIGFLLLLFTIYLYLFRKKIYYDNQKIILFALIFVFLSFLTFLLNQLIVKAPVQYLIILPAASMLITIIFDSRVGFYSTVILALIIGALRGNDYTFSVANLIAGALSVYTVRDIKNRSQIFRSFSFILIGYAASILAFGLERFASAETILTEFAFAGSNALISPVLTYGLLIFFERSFKITTDLTLLELTNFDRPLLKELARSAPGTFNHSMTMGTLAESAAELIGANSLLARVGAYYHDIGKTISPQNFVENQRDSNNIHENIRPEESAHLISTHVKEGIELGKQYNLPKEIINFIPMHHGTMVMTFFYEKAKELYGEENIRIDDYRYPGPKPNTKETAIVMLADGCESAVRSIKEPDQQKVENVIEKIIDSRIEDGQLDEAPLTFGDISKIKESFKNILLGQHHRRIRYPKQDEIEKGTDKTENEE